MTDMRQLEVVIPTPSSYEKRRAIRIIGQHARNSTELADFIDMIIEDE